MNQPDRNELLYSLKGSNSFPVLGGIGLNLKCGDIDCISNGGFKKKKKIKIEKFKLSHLQSQGWS